MKIFNWVHKRFHHRVLNDGFDGNVKKNELEANDRDTQAFLKEVGLVHGIDSWRDGILTIGTFGFDLLKPFNHQNEYVVLESEEEFYKESHEFSQTGNNDDDEDEDDEDSDGIQDELNPLIYTNFGHSFGDMGPNSDDHAISVAKPDVILSIDGVPITPFESSNEISTNEADGHHSESDQRQRKGQRTTLADLFMADHHGHEHHVDQLKLEYPCKGQQDLQKKLNVGSRSGLAFAKKLIPKVKEDSRPIKNLQRLMRRMLKRKIHPAELDHVKLHKSDGQKPCTAGELITNYVKNDASESVSLLPIQGATSVD